MRCYNDAMYVIIYNNRRTCSMFGITQKNRNVGSGKENGRKKRQQSIIYDANTHHLKLNGTMGHISSFLKIISRHAFMLYNGVYACHFSGNYDRHYSIVS